VVVLIASGCTVTGDDEQPAGERFEMPAYLFLLPDGWKAGVDDDPASHEQVNFSGAAEGVGGNISRNPVGEEPIRARIERIGSSSREHEGVRNVGPVHERKDDIDGEDAWLVDATYDSALRDEAPFTTRTIGFDHDGSDFVVSFNAPAASFERHAEALDELLGTWEFT
jgi:hypothetical protein